MPKNYDFENVETLPVAKINDNPARSVYTILKAKTAQFINKHLLIPPCQKDDDNNAVPKNKNSSHITKHISKITNINVF